MSKKGQMIQTAIGILIIMLLIIGIVSVSKAETPLTRIEYRVRPGDTLWDIATEYAPRGTDLDRYIFDLKKYNGLEKSSIYPGMVLEIVTEAE